MLFFDNNFKFYSLQRLQYKEIDTEQWTNGGRPTDATSAKYINFCSTVSAVRI